MTPEAIVASARAAIGTPFRHQGREAGRGLDCAGLLVHVAREIGADPRDRGGYARMPTGGQIEEALQDHVDAGVLVRVPLAEMQEGDLILMRFDSERASRHLGICAGATMVHSWAQVGKVCEHGITPEWRARIARVYRFTGVDHE